jgi:hypothetical protein
MPFLGLHQVLPAVAESETRTMVVAEPGTPLPMDCYTFNEEYCADLGCDCRRVMLTVVSMAGQQIEAVINYGWETPAFYARWMRTTDRKVIADLQGPLLNPGSPATRRGPAVLDLFKQMMLTDSAYIARLAAHYRAFRAQIAGRIAPTIPVKKVGRNDPCPCGSNRKWKVCCGRQASAE